eukprot:5591809-Amphidinium_carterae.1
MTSWLWTCRLPQQEIKAASRLGLSDMYTWQGHAKQNRLPNEPPPMGSHPSLYGSWQYQPFDLTATLSDPSHHSAAFIVLYKARHDISIAFFEHCSMFWKDAWCSPATASLALRAHANNVTQRCPVYGGFCEVNPPRT